jgi:hypothetical protein
LPHQLAPKINTSDRTNGHISAMGLGSIPHAPHRPAGNDRAQRIGRRASSWLVPLWCVNRVKSYSVGADADRIAVRDGRKSEQNASDSDAWHGF